MIDPAKLSAMTKPETVDLIRALQEHRGLPVSANAVLIHQKSDALAAQAIALCGDDLTVLEDGAIQGAVPAPAPAEQPVEQVVEPGVLPAPAPLASAEENKQATEIPCGADLNRGNPTEEAPARAPKAKAEKPPKAPRGASDAGVITVISANPRREGSAAHLRYSQMQTGDTVAQYVAKVAAATGSTEYATGSLRKAVKQGHVTVAR